MKVRELLENFEADARLLLLFLRNLERISVFERDRNSKTCRLVYRVELSDSCLADVRRARADFVEKLRDGAWQDRTVTASYPVTISTESFRDRTPTSQKRRYAFLVTNYCCGGQVSLCYSYSYSYSPRSPPRCVVCDDGCVPPCSRRALSDAAIHLSVCLFHANWTKMVHLVL